MCLFVVVGVFWGVVGVVILLLLLLTTLLLTFKFPVYFHSYACVVPTLARDELRSAPQVARGGDVVDLSDVST